RPKPAAAPRAHWAPDRGIAITNYLLGKSVASGAHAESYETTRIDLAREHGGATAEVALYEMYWADLSRLSGSVPRLVSEASTLMLRMSKRGRETVNEAAEALRQRRLRRRGGRAAAVRASAWRAVVTLQTAMDWLFVNVLALLFLQFGALAALLIVLGFAA